MNTYRAVLLALLAAVAVQAIYYYPQLPEVMASHYGAGGQADGWMTKKVFFAFDLGMTAFLALVFLGMGSVRWPDSMINLPHKEYWLAPERREETLDLFRRELLVFGIATVLLMLIVMQWVIEGNLDGSETLPALGMWLLMGSYLTFVMVWTIRFATRFYRLPANPR